ncbi:MULTISPECIES: 2Fe-2S iron-sulfur cluster-binding protein [Rhodococcus]|uniref:2Fe-2S iron-sulfur cluster-binding protein n=1 Tax=Rhodococcus qingshengii JCM 15477 TaxID=1303681 RepID=A0AB38R6R4_RHOSG|nr:MULTISPECIES: 2Fe-2S iron-sulfur cluster-binding protein [Rhodococcus]MCD2131401.1 2Fe-2S iron-sulfur cluster-binding protein [Rhodococcus qingshengii]UPU40820.1 2Fe-2S iron-sulfur cluster-binding protein [Rhodococcus qingshengii JCM 15477]
MPKIRFSCSGSEWAVDAEVGTTVMLAAVSEGVDGITAECGGNAMCATCHVYVDPETATSLPSMTQEEDDMLDCAAGERRPTSRLSCQIAVTEELDGLRVEVAGD